MDHLLVELLVEKLQLSSIMNFRKRRSRVLGRPLLFRALDMFILTNELNERVWF